MVWEENKHPRDESGQFTSKGNEGQGGEKSNYKGTQIEKLTKLNGDEVYQFGTKDGDVLTFKSLDEAKQYIDNNDDFDNDFEEEFIENIDNIDYDKAEENEKKNADKGKNPNRKDKYGNELVSDEAFKAGQKGVKAYLDYMTQYYDLDKLKGSKVFLSGLQSAASKAIIEGGYDPNLDVTYEDFNEIVSSVLGEEVDFESEKFTGKKYSGYQPKKDENIMFDENDTKEQHLEKRKKLLGY